MDYFQKFLRGGVPSPKVAPDYAAEFHESWESTKETLLNPDERQLSKGIRFTDVPRHLQSMTDALIRESTQHEDSTGPCLEYLLKNDILNTLVRLSETDRPFGVQAEVLRTISNMVVLLDERFLVHSAVHKAVIRLLQACMGDEIEDVPLGAGKPMGAAGSTARVSPSEYEEDLVNLLCILCSRIRTYPELLMIFFHDKNWFQHRVPLATLQEEDVDSDEEDYGEEKPRAEHILFDADPEPPKEKDIEDADDSTEGNLSATPTKQSVLANTHSNPKPLPSPTPSATPSARSAHSPGAPPPRPNYEFLIFNYLMRFIHREGVIGDFGRAGLLFLLDIAMSAHEIRAQSGGSGRDPVRDAATALADYILEGDFAEVLGAGLGAVYSLLPYKLEVRPDGATAETKDQQGGGMSLGSVTLGTIEEEKQKAAFEEERVQSLGVEVSTNPEFRSRLDHFLTLVEFVEQVLQRVEITASAGDHETEADAASVSDVPTIVGRAIAFSVIDNIRSIFLQNVLYPSVLECSDADGSAVAVMSYINTLLLEPGRLREVLIDFLMADGDEDITPRRRPLRRPDLQADAKDKKLRRRSSAMVLLSLESPQSTSGPSGYFNSLGRFTLKDLLLSNLRLNKHKSATGPQHTSVAALNLLHTLMTGHCEKSVVGLLSVIREPPPSLPMPSLPSVQEILEEDEDDDDEFLYPGAERVTSKRAPLRWLQLPQLLSNPDATSLTLEREQKMYLDLVGKIDGTHEDFFSTKFDNYLRDSIENIQGHCCYTREAHHLHNPLLPGIHDAQKKGRHRLMPTDPLITTLLQSLRNFFANTPEYNIALTGVIADISSCPERSLAGWLTLAPKEQVEPTWSTYEPWSPTAASEEAERDDTQSVDYATDAKLQSENRAPAFDVRLRDQKATPVLYAILSGLVEQLDRYRMIVDDFDGLLTERRRGLLFSENLNDALSLILDTESSILTPLGTPSRPSATPAQPMSLPPKAKSKGGMSFVTSLLTPKKKPAGSSSSEVTTPSNATPKEVTASPFAPHYRKTTTMDVQAFVAAPPVAGPWAPADRKPTVNYDLSFTSDGFDTDDFHSRTVLRQEEEEDDMTVRKVSLSHLLDNVVILEEAVKELAAIIRVRVSLGIDDVRYI